MNTTDTRKRLRRKSLWTVGDFAAYAGISARQARRMLVAFDRELGGMLLRPSKGSNRRYSFFWAALAKHCPDAFVDDPIETLTRTDRLEDRVDVAEVSLRAIAAQTGQNTRDIVRLRTRRPAAA